MLSLIAIPQNIPGHAIEAGWFLLRQAKKTGDVDLKKTALEQFMLNPLNYGWDKEYGGIYYFLDADGLSPTQLEWDMKLWWPHNEAMISFLMAYKETNDVMYLDLFAKVFDYSCSHFVDEKQGEWFGYLNRRGEVTHRFKGGPWKGKCNDQRKINEINNISEKVQHADSLM
ncbi:hypothetical protein FSP39_012016 [Pinctada imbricata]|uniref:N-acylglucosamine 2-epimerase n=1 Tax=Pinctada imbricata TaxID=66713 RepID=A0AA88YC41_PINIB|nr:hypothetical protein FSP39_012016 [Pinctada imbricata]